MKKWWVFLVCILGISIPWYAFYLRHRYWNLTTSVIPGRSEILPVVSPPEPLLNRAAIVNEKSPQKTRHLKEIHGPYFFSIPISKFSSEKIPCLMIQVEDKDVMVELDLGLRGEATFSQEIIKNIEKKVLVGERTLHGARGKSYRKNRYKIPKIHILNLIFRDCLIEEESEEFLSDTILLRSTETHPPESSGRVGWELFANCNLFLDLANSCIAFCDSAKTLENQGYSIKKFAKIPLHTERGFVEMLVRQAEGVQKWILDTGTTWNVVNANDNTKTIEEMVSNPSNQIKLPLKIADTDFGLLPFYKIPIPLPIQVDAVLGTEFFKTHQVFVDFYEQQIYISTPHETRTKTDVLKK